MAENTTPKKDKKPGFNYYWIYGIALMAIAAISVLNSMERTNEIDQETFFGEFVPTNHVEKIEVVNDRTVNVYIKEKMLDQDLHKDLEKGQSLLKGKGPHYRFTPLDLEVFAERVDEIQRGLPPGQRFTTSNVTKTEWGEILFSYGFLILLFILLWVFIMRRMAGGMGGGGSQIFNIGKSKATLFDRDTNVNVTFDDVAGLEEAKEEIMEIVDFLKNPNKYTNLGGKIPKGAILVGPPGTGKTLIAKAMAGEARVPFFSISGSDFVEMFVGVGASRVRDLFKQAREKAPCIIFIDEIDAIGRARGKSMMQGGNDERENTLNQLLVEMDGFSSKKGIIMVAATNRPDVLDTALLRPGRFDRQIAIDRPDLKGREAIFEVHSKAIKMADGVDLAKLSAQTAGFVGADIANVCNEAALIAARKGKKQVEFIDFQDAIDRNIGGLERKNRIISPAEREIIAYHEAGHAICGWYLEHADPLLKVTIVPRGIAALGYAQYIPKEQFLYNSDQLVDQICMMLGGRVAEDIIFEKVSTGAQNDLERITKMAYGMVTVYGMSDKVGNVSFNDTSGQYQFKKPYSDETSKIIDEEVRAIIDSCYERTKELLTERRHELETIAEELLDKEILFKVDLENLIGRRPSEEIAEERAARNGAGNAELYQKSKSKKTAENVSDKEPDED